MNELLLTIEELLGIEIHIALLLLMLILTRWLLMSITIPILGSQLLPSMIRISFSLLLSIVTFSLLDKGHSLSELNLYVVVLLFIKEAMIGFIIGFFSSVIFYLYEMFGQLVDLARAASMSKMLVPELKSQSSPVGTLFFQLSLVIFLSLNLHEGIINTALISFIKFPPLSLSVSKLFSDNMLEHSLSVMGILFATALRLALPIITICFLIDLTFGLMNRVAPQINAYFLSLPAKITGGLVLLFFLISYLVDDFESNYDLISRLLEHI